MELIRKRFPVYKRDIQNTSHIYTLFNLDIESSQSNSQNIFKQNCIGNTNATAALLEMFRFLIFSRSLFSGVQLDWDIDSYLYKNP